MSMETTCPKCHTVFRVTTEQLNAHQGDVRCGMCAMLFNAFDSLAPARPVEPEQAQEVPRLEKLEPEVTQPSQPALEILPEDEPAAALPPEMQEEVQEEASEPEFVAEVPPQPSDTIEIAAPLYTEPGDTFADFGAALESPAAEEAAIAQSDAMLIVLEPEPAEEEHMADFASALEAEPAVPETPVEMASLISEMAEDRPEVPAAAAEAPAGKAEAIKVELDTIEDIYADFAKEADLPPLPAGSLAQGESETAAVVQEPELPAKPVFVAPLVKAEDESVDLAPDEDFLGTLAPPAKKKRGWLWGMAALPLLVVLAGQFAYFYRVDLAARYPVSRPMLVQVCGMIGCDVPLPRNADLLKIESSDLEADTEFPSQVTLSSVVSNRAAYRQAYPQLELTLTSHEDQPIARRIFKPEEYLVASVDVPKGMAGNSEVSVRLNLDLGELNAVGYRLYVFYPAGKS